MSANVSRRSARVAERIKAELMELLIRGVVRDPEAAGVYVSGVTIGGDLKNARVYIRLTEVDASPERREAAVRALSRASGYLRKEVAPRLKLKYVPELSFHWDEHVDQVSRVEALLMEISQETQRSAKASGDQ
jgi:ribosome-binding factor A